MKKRTYASLGEYLACVETYYKQIGPYVRHAHLSESSLFVVFLPGDMGKTWLKLLAKDICLVVDYGGIENERLSYSFFAGGGGKEVWTREARHKIRRWFVERAPDVRLWGEKGRVSG
jgi:hypothetical protein